jgi:hypothetical protein
MGEGSWRSRLLIGAATILGAALALHAAVRLIEAVWPALLIISFVAAFLAVGAVVLLRYARRW